MDDLSLSNSFNSTNALLWNDKGPEITIFPQAIRYFLKCDVNRKSYAIRNHVIKDMAMGQLEAV